MPEKKVVQPTCVVLLACSFMSLLFWLRCPPEKHSMNELSPPGMKIPYERHKSMINHLMSITNKLFLYQEVITVCESECEEPL